MNLRIKRGGRQRELPGVAADVADAPEGGLPSEYGELLLEHMVRVEVIVVKPALPHGLRERLKQGIDGGGGLRECPEARGLPCSQGLGEGEEPLRADIGGEIEVHLRHPVSREVEPGLCEAPAGIRIITVLLLPVHHVGAVRGVDEDRCGIEGYSRLVRELPLREARVRVCEQAEEAEVAHRLRRGEDEGRERYEICLVQRLRGALVIEVPYCHPCPSCELLPAS